MSKEKSKESAPRSSHCYATSETLVKPSPTIAAGNNKLGLDEIVPVIEQMLEIWAKYIKAEEKPVYLGEMTEGLYHLIESIPKEHRPAELPRFFIST